MAGSDLPEGATCGDCVHIRRCGAMFGHVATDTYCDWVPSKFRATQPAPQFLATEDGEFNGNSEIRVCDCERSANGLGLSGRPCDCGAPIGEVCPDCDGRGCDDDMLCPMPCEACCGKGII
jgi:hypothetical protein